MAKVRPRVKRENIEGAQLDGNDEHGHEAAIERLREIAENGLDDPAMDGLDDIDPAAVAAAAGEPRRKAGANEELRAHFRIVEAIVFAAPQPMSERFVEA